MKEKDRDTDVGQCLCPSLSFISIFLFFSFHLLLSVLLFLALLSFFLIPSPLSYFFHSYPSCFLHPISSSPTHSTSTLPSSRPHRPLPTTTAPPDDAWVKLLSATTSVG